MAKKPNGFYTPPKSNAKTEKREEHVFCHKAYIHGVCVSARAGREFMIRCKQNFYFLFFFLHLWVHLLCGRSLFSRLFLHFFLAVTHIVCELCELIDRTSSFSFSYSIVSTSTANSGGGGTKPEWKSLSINFNQQSKWLNLPRVPKNK